MNNTYPTLIDNLLKLKISQIKDFFLPNQNEGIVRWETKESIYVNVYLSSKNPYLEIRFKAKGKKTIQKIELIAKPSNLGKGTVYFFKCPITQTLCRKLYLCKRTLLFKHYSDIENSFYEKQLYSKKDRLIMTIRESMYGNEKLYETIYSKGFTKHYKGKQTKRYKSLLNQIENNQNREFAAYQKLRF